MAAVPSQSKEKGYIRMQAKAIRRGSLHVIAGPMGCGKSLELLKLLEMLRVRERTYAVVKPHDDSRDGNFVKSRFLAQPIEAHFIKSPGDFAAHLHGSQVIAIDEAQFLERYALQELIELMDRGISVIASGLDQDFTGRPFGIMPDLLAMADQVTKLRSICEQCKQDATRTQLIVEPKGRHEPWPAYQQRTQPIRDFLDGKTRTLIGNFGMYQSRCHRHHSLPELSEPPATE